MKPVRDGRQPDDADLLRAAARGDGGAFGTLVDRHGDALYQVALSYTHHRDDAEDLVQVTLLAAFRGAGGFAGRASVKTWLLRILGREATRMWRAKNRRQMKSLDASPVDPPGSPAASKSVEQRMDIDLILSGLSEMHREVLVMREIWDMSYDEIAAALGVPRGTVESRLSRARAQFRERFEGT
jgi:RNA polymerase sigma-70 factor (ECF subfamily)